MPYDYNNEEAITKQIIEKINEALDVVIEWDGYQHDNKQAIFQVHKDTGYLYKFKDVLNTSIPANEEHSLLREGIKGIKKLIKDEALKLQDKLMERNLGPLEIPDKVYERIAFNLHLHHLNELALLAPMPWLPHSI